MAGQSYLQVRITRGTGYVSTPMESHDLRIDLAEGATEAMLREAFASVAGRLLTVAEDRMDTAALRVESQVEQAAEWEREQVAAAAEDDAHDRADPGDAIDAATARVEADREAHEDRQRDATTAS